MQDTDFKFELVKPSIPQVMGRVSQDLMLTGHDVNTEKPNMSPTLGDASSMHSSMPRSPLVPTHATAALLNLLMCIGNAS